MKTAFVILAALVVLAACSAVPPSAEQIAARKAAKAERVTAERYEALRDDMRGPDPLGGAY